MQGPHHGHVGANLVRQSACFNRVSISKLADRASGCDLACDHDVGQAASILIQHIAAGQNVSNLSAD
jgi:hypothetical protein